MRPSLPLLASISLLALLLLAACDVALTDGVFDDQEIEISSEEIQGDIADGAGPGLGTMDGSWVLVHENSACLILGRGDEVLSYSTLLLHLAQQGQRVIEERHVCAVDPSPVLDFRASISPEVLAAVDIVAIDDGFVSTAGPGGSYTSGTEIILWGIDLSDPLHEPVPRDADDPRVVDQDADGQPGVTFQMEGSSCERYVSQRTITRYSGVFTSPNRIEGRTTTFVETRTLGSTGLCGVQVEIIPNDQTSRFVMLRADGQGTNLDLRNDEGEVTCDEVRPIRTQLMPRRAPLRENCPRRR